MNVRSMNSAELEQYVKKLDRETCKLKFTVVRIAQQLGLSAEQLIEIENKATVDMERASLLHRTKRGGKTK